MLDGPCVATSQGFWGTVVGMLELSEVCACGGSVQLKAESATPSMREWFLARYEAWLERHAECLERARADLPG